MLLMALPNEHLLTFSQYKDAKTLFEAIQARFDGNDAIKKTQRTLLKQMYENFNAPSTESLDSIFNRLQKIVSQLAILGENISKKDLNMKFLRSLPSEWNTHKSQVSRLRNQDSSRKTVNVEDTYSKAMVAIDGAGFDWSYMADDEVPTNMALMAFSYSEEFQHPKFKGYGPKDSKSVCVDTLNDIKKAPDALIIEDWVSDSDEDESEEMMVQKPVLKNVENKTVQREVRPVWNNAMRTNHQNFSNSKKNFAPTAVLTKSDIVPISTARHSSSRAATPVSAARPIDTAASKPLVNEHDGGYVVFGGGAKGGKISGKCTIRTGKGASFDADQGAEVDYNSFETVISVSPIPSTKIHKDHPKEQIIGEVYRNKRDQQGIVDRNKARLVAQGHREEEGINYDEVFAPVAQIETIRLFLAYASFMNFTVYQMYVKTAFLYGIIEEEVYVSQPPGFVDPEFPDRVYKVEKALYGLHHAPRAWYETLSTYLLDNRFRRGTIDKTFFIKHIKDDILLVQVYVDDIIFGSTKRSLSIEFEQLMHKRFQMSYIRELTFFLGLQVEQQKDGIFLSHDKYVCDILKKFCFSSVKLVSTPMETHKPLSKDVAGTDVDVHLYRSMIGSLMYLTSSRPDIMFDVLWLQNQLLDYGYNFMQTKIHVDNESTICVVKNHVYHSKTKDIEIRHHFIRDSYEKRLNLKGYLINDGYADLVQHADKKELATPGQTTTGKEFSNPLMAGSLPKTTLPNQLMKVNGARHTYYCQKKVNAAKHKLTTAGTSCLPNVVIFEELARMRVEKLKEENRSLTKELKSFNTKVESLAFKETVMDKEKSSKQGRNITDIDADAEVNLESVYNLDMAHEETVLSMQDVIDADGKAVAEEMVEVITTAKIIVDEVSTAGGELNANNEEPVSAAPTNITTPQPSEDTKTTIDITTAPKAKGIVFHDMEESTTRKASLKPQVKDKGKAKLVEEPEVLKSRKSQIPIDEEVTRRIKAEWNADMKDNIDWNEVVKQGTGKEKVEKDQTSKKKNGDKLEKDNAEKQKLKEQQEAEELKRNLKIVHDDEDDVFVNVTPLSSKPLKIMDYKIYKEGKKENFQIIRANEDSVWKLQKRPQGLVSVKNWKLFDSCRVHCVTLDTIQLYLLVEKMYPLTNYTP
uniref:Copia protein n=1 Tax=Tanacetum cinerariifolium TaxID=118510 RepID=A0A6L2NVT2_TANCI|nr:copia protein [Tanacetum cinerariifolium]